MELSENDGGNGQQPPNSLESILLKGASQLDGIQLSDEMIKSYICTAHLRIIRQLNCTIRGKIYSTFFTRLLMSSVALREITRMINGTVSVAEDSPTLSPTPEQEDTPKYVENVMSKTTTNDIFSQVSKFHSLRCR